MKRRCGGLGILIIGVGVSVLVTACMPASWLIFLLGVLLIWAGFNLICK